MLKKLVSTIFLVVALVIASNGQQVDTILALKHLKTRLFTEFRIGFMGESALKNYHNRALQATFLASKGFDDFVFFKISSQVLALDTIDEGKKILSYETPACLRAEEECYFVYAFDKRNKAFLRLKGTTENDFKILYADLQSKWMYWKPIKKINKSLIKQFTNDYWIDGVDLKCLLLTLKSKRGRCLDYFSPELDIH